MSILAGIGRGRYTLSSKALYLDNSAESYSAIYKQAGLVKLILPELPDRATIHYWLARSLPRWGTAILRLLPAESAHELGLWLLEKRALEYLPRFAQPGLLQGLNMNVPGIGQLAHPIGLAAGFDKNARVALPLLQMGFSFMEIGTVTPRPQVGNPRPRIFRDATNLALINRMGFPSEGMAVVLERLLALRWFHDQVPLGVNLGKNKATPDHLAIEDYILGLKTFAPHSRFLVINISSPNTPGLRALASEEFLQQLAEREAALLPKLWVKLDPDMGKAKLQKVVAVIQKCGYQGLVLTNTHRVEWPEAGGQSGHPLSIMSSTALEWAHEVHQGKLAMIAAGGVMTGGDVFQKIVRGASAVELYTALVYRGPWAVFEILLELKAELKLHGFATLEAARGSLYGS